MFIALFAVCSFVGCGTNQPLSGAANPFATDPIALDGGDHDVESDLIGLGPMIPGEVLRLRVSGPAVETVLVLRRDDDSGETGTVVGGGPAGQSFQYRITQAGQYFLFALIDTQATGNATRITVSAEHGDPSFRPPAEQFVLVEFAEGFLHDPGLFDPDSQTEADRAFLADLSPLVAEEIINALRDIFAGTPVRIITADDAPPEGPFAQLTFLPDRVLAGQQDAIDSALPPPDPSRPECQVRVTFGQVLPEAARHDSGNLLPDDQAVVYVGSFQGRGVSCQTAILNSVNNIVLSLSQTAAHEIGHLVGLFHVDPIDIMNRTASMALQRELPFARGQIQVDRSSGGLIITQVLSRIIQDPQVYFRSAFDVP